MISRTFRLAAAMLLTTGALLAPATAAEAPQRPDSVFNSVEQTKYWYCKVSYYHNGKLQTSYLGGYISEAEARKQYRNWAIGIGGKARPKLLNVFKE